DVQHIDGRLGDGREAGPVRGSHLDRAAAGAIEGCGRERRALAGRLERTVVVQVPGEGEAAGPRIIPGGRDANRAPLVHGVRPAGARRRRRLVDADSARLLGLDVPCPVTTEEVDGNGALRGDAKGRGVGRTTAQGAWGARRVPYGVVRGGH